MPEIARIINDGKNWNSNVCKVTVVASVTKCACSGTSHTTTALVCKISKKCIKEGLQEDNTKILVLIWKGLSLISHQSKPKVQRAALTSDVIKKLAPFVLSKL